MRARESIVKGERPMAVMRKPSTDCTDTGGRLGSQRLLALQRLVEGGRPVGREDRPALDDSVRQREAEVGDEKLLDVGSADVGSLRDLDNTQDLWVNSVSCVSTSLSDRSPALKRETKGRT